MAVHQGVIAKHLKSMRRLGDSKQSELSQQFTSKLSQKEVKTKEQRVFLEELFVSCF